MNNTLMTQLGIGSLDVTYIFIGLIALIIVLFILNIVSLSKISRLKKKYDSFMRGRNAKSMEKEIQELFADIDFLKESAETNRKEIKRIYKRLITTFQKLGIVKYDAFNQMGGQLSFALALLDEYNNGFVINSVHSSEGSYCYVKGIESGECEISLGEEEQQAIDIAMRMD